MWQHLSRLKVGWTTRTIWVTWVTFGGSSGSHPKIKLSGCDPDITCSWVGIWWVNFGSDEYTETLLVWNQLIIPSCFETCGVQRFHLRAKDRFCIVPRMKKCMALFYIKKFPGHVILLLKRKLQDVGHKWVICGSHPACSVGQWVKWSTGVTHGHFQPWYLCIRMYLMYNHGQFCDCSTREALYIIKYLACIHV